MSRPFPNGRLAHACPGRHENASERGRELHALVSAARAGDDHAWTALVRRFDGPLRRVARSYRLSAADVDDALQTTWLRLFTNIERLDSPAAIGAWLATTTRRECLRILQAPLREHLTDDPLLADGSHVEELAAGLIAAQRREALTRALDALPERHRRLMARLSTDARPNYQRISQQLGMPVGSIGPIRQRCLTRLARDETLAALASTLD
jgi:RNA polymerase sigma factor (sigma-70 family)